MMGSTNRAYLKGFAAGCQTDSVAIAAAIVVRPAFSETA
jgi:hypothetical protein